MNEDANFWVFLVNLCCLIFASARYGYLIGRRHERERRP